MVRVCSKCGFQITDEKAFFCKKCGAILPEFSLFSESNERPFNYSSLFYFIIYTDLIFCFIFGAASFGVYFDVSSRTYHNAWNLYMAIMLFINFLIDIFLLINKRKSPNTININVCLIKFLFGFLGIMTIIQSLYFAMIYADLRNAYNKGVERKEEEVFNSWCS